MSSYDDFEPMCKWTTEETQDILEVHLQGFKKNQLRVQINNNGLLTISGERPVDENRRSRFRNEINLSKNYNLDGIRAKFSGGILYITVRKKTSSIETPHGQHTLAQENENPNQPINYQDKETNGSELKESGSKDNNIAANGNGRSSLETIRKPTESAAEIKSSITGLKMSGKTALKLGALAAVVVVVSIGAFVAYKYRQAIQVED
ncbi:hypothetical protein Pint_20071 [Pistacia integerrima]|uniref:Uncharacterized protein n=1 Tax=Pistacia integerrima TaxID=434235 RepID=A0ACC0XDE3_9ROSI|nr:hypothetical protein Pint_20071 [Pistacia integerrima]